MKKVILLLAASFTGISLSAQSFGLQGGANLASISFKSQGIMISTSDKFGFLLGVVGEFPLGQSVNFRPEINFVQKGGKLTIPDLQENTVSLNYLELPLNVVYNSAVKNGTLFFGAGPSFAFGISGTEKAKDLEENTEESTTVKFDGKKNEEANDGKSHYKAADIGFGLLAGYKLNSGLFFNINYSFGISNITAETDLTAKNKGFSFKIGYIFKKSK